MFSYLLTVYFCLLNKSYHMLHVMLLHNVLTMFLQALWITAVGTVKR